MGRPRKPPGPDDAPPAAPTRSHRFILEAPYWCPSSRPYESPQRLRDRLKKEAPDWYQQMITWRRLRARDLHEIDLMSKSAAHVRSWTEASFMFPPPGITATSPVRALEQLSHPPARPEPALDKEGVERLKRLAQGLVKVHPQIFEAEEAQFMSEEIFASMPEEWAEVDDPERFVEDVLWTYANLKRKVSEKQAPSAGAWSLLHFARENTEKFFTACYPKALDYSAKIKAAKLAHERELRKMEIEAELEQHRANAMTPEEAKELAATLDLMKELGVPYKEVARGIKLKKEPPPELVARMEE